jgi:hypothetical protein
VVRAAIEQEPAASTFVVSTSQNPSGVQVAPVQVAGVKVAGVHDAPINVHVAAVQIAAVQVAGDAHAVRVLFVLSEQTPCASQVALVVLLETATFDKAHEPASLHNALVVALATEDPPTEHVP